MRKFIPKLQTYANNNLSELKLFKFQSTLTVNINVD